MRDLYVVGGQQRPDAVVADEWHRHQKALVLRINPDRNTCETVFEYESPPEVTPGEKASILFKAGSFQNGRFLLCTPTEVLVRSFPDFQPLAHISHPWFHDVHHVCVGPRDHLFVANTGLDMVVELDAQGQLVQEHWVLDDEPPWQRFSPETDYRKVRTTKPHRAHPNYVFSTGDDVWATRFEQRDAICLTDRSRRIDIGVERPHDGIVGDDTIYFTTVDGHVILVDRETLTVRDVVDLGTMNGGLRYMGWCRGLAVIDRDRVCVGFSSLRPTKWSANCGWVKGGLSQLKALWRQPARIAVFDLKRRRMDWRFPLNEGGMSTVFSIHPIATEEYALAKSA